MSSASQDVPIPGWWSLAYGESSQLRCGHSGFPRAAPREEILTLEYEFPDEQTFTYNDDPQAHLPMASLFCPIAG